MASLLELGAGFHPDFDGRENALMNGVLLGRSRRAMRASIDAVIDFAELGEAAGEPVRTYSTGMAMRLGFAIALGIEPKVLLLDEVFAVGDLHFQKKCVDRLFAFKRGGGTLIFCSHSLYDVRQMCDEALWLRDGRLAAQGAAAKVTNAYAGWQHERDEVRRDASDARPDVPHLCAARLSLAGSEAALQRVASGADLELHVDWKNPLAPERSVHLGVTFTRQDQTLVSGLATHLDDFVLEGRAGHCSLHLPGLQLLAGTFTVVVYLFDEFGVHRHHELVLPRDLVVENDSREVGLVRMPHEWRADAARCATPALPRKETA